MNTDKANGFDNVSACIRVLRLLRGNYLSYFLSVFPVSPVVHSVFSSVFSVVLLLLWFLAFCPSAAQARVVVVVCERLTWEDVKSECPFLLDLMQQNQCALGLMNTAVAGPKNPASALLTLAQGQLTLSEPADEQAVTTSEQVGSELGTGAVVYKRRVGADVPPNRTIVHLNVASLTQRGVIGQGLGAILMQAHPPRRILICGNADANTRQRRGALLAVDAQGTATGNVALISPDTGKPFGITDDINTLARYGAATDADIFVAVLGDLARVEATRAQLTPAAYHAARQQALSGLDSFLLQLFAIRHLNTQAVDLLLVSPCPPAPTVEQVSPNKIGETWEQLTPIIALGPHFPPGLLTSPTTRTPGLVSNTDIAPSLLHALNIPPPSAMTGRPMQVVTVSGGSEAVLQAVSRLDYITTLNAQAMTRVLMPIGGLCFALVLAAVFAYRWKGTRAAHLFLPGLIFTQSLPLGCLLATIKIPPTLLEYGLRILAWMAALTAFSYILSRLLRLSPPNACSLIGIMLIVIDLCCGQQLLKGSVWSGYALSGIRYYGIGNEYLGVVLGYSLLGGFAWIGEEGKRKIVIVCWLALLVLLGWPSLGANAGSLIVTGAGFGVGAWSLVGRRVTWWTAFVCLLVGIALSFAVGALDARLFGAQASHAGNVLNAAGSGRGANYLLEIMARKVGMNLRLLTTPFFLLGASLVAVTAGLMRALLGKALLNMLAARPRLRQSLPVLAVTLLSALLFKDSGVVTAALLAGITCLYFLWYTLTATLPAQTEVTE